MGFVRDDRAPWLLVPGILLTLSGVSLLTLRQPALAAPPAAAPATAPAVHSSHLEDDGDGDGDELLEHWGDPKYSREARLQMAGLAGAFLLLGISGRLRRVKVRTHTWPQTVDAVTDIGAEVITKPRKAA